MWLNPWKSENEHILRIPIWSKSWERRVHESSSVGQSATVQRPIDLQKFHGTARVHLYWLVVSGLCDSAYMKPHEYTDSIPRSPSPATAVPLDRRTRSRRTCEIRAYPAANSNLATCGTKTATRFTHKHTRLQAVTVCKNALNWCAGCVKDHAHQFTGDQLPYSSLRMSSEPLTVWLCVSIKNDTRSQPAAPRAARPLCLLILQNYARPAGLALSRQQASTSDSPSQSHRRGVIVQLRHLAGGPVPKIQMLSGSSARRPSFSSQQTLV
jgi:hypothetical protein